MDRRLDREEKMGPHPAMINYAELYLLSLSYCSEAMVITSSKGFCTIYSLELLEDVILVEMDRYQERTRPPQEMMYHVDFYLPSLSYCWKAMVMISSKGFCTIYSLVSLEDVILVEMDPYQERTRPPQEMMYHVDFYLPSLSFCWKAMVMISSKGFCTIYSLVLLEDVILVEMDPYQERTRPPQEMMYHVDFYLPSLSYCWKAMVMISSKGFCTIYSLVLLEDVILVEMDRYQERTRPPQEMMYHVEFYLPSLSYCWKATVMIYSKGFCIIYSLV
ncbi:Hypothetical protein NTJ_01818 [Nesidiocoris tenuis]|uniref:CNH domain-containing protein n=1 Tax=Nesidiocoris tenuis TaxID=355587 RepID=A0ABN7ADS7_9HEMI|nr:Hypothetical protein NTJ_01818 [Nesidiocoris tenuis]